jgi:hypothetical protein
MERKQVHRPGLATLGIHHYTKGLGRKAPWCDMTEPASGDPIKHAFMDMVAEFCWRLCGLKKLMAFPKSSAPISLKPASCLLPLCVRLQFKPRA